MIVTFFVLVRRKLLALALASLLTTESPVVLSRIYTIFLNIAETLNDITRPDENGGVVDSLMAGVTDSVLDTDDIDYETEHDSRWGSKFNGPRDFYCCHQVLVNCEFISYTSGNGRWLCRILYIPSCLRSMFRPR